MLKTTLAVVLIFAVSPASACEVRVGPEGFAGPDDPYILLVNVTEPVLPTYVPADEAGPHDCADGNHPSDASDVAQRVLTPAQETVDDYVVNGPKMSVSGFVPECVAVPENCTALSTCSPYVAYNVATGEYLVGDPYWGTTGVGVKADCELCPPPTCC